MEQVLMREAQRWVAPRSAWIEARAGALWVTRSGDLVDHVVRPGMRLAVSRGDDLVLQSWRRDQPAVWDWQAREVCEAAELSGTREGEAPRAGPTLPAWAGRWTAALLRVAAVRLDALAARARSAALGLGAGPA